MEYMALTMRMNGDQDERAGKLVVVSSSLGNARSSWRVMRGVRQPWEGCANAAECNNTSALNIISEEKSV